MASRSPRGGNSSPPTSARNPNRVKTRTGSTSTQPIDELGPQLRGGPTRPPRGRQRGNPEPVQPVSDTDDSEVRTSNPR